MDLESGVSAIVFVLFLEKRERERVREGRRGRQYCGKVSSIYSSYLFKPI